MENPAHSNKAKENPDKAKRNESSDKNQVKTDPSTKEETKKVNYKISFCSSEEEGYSITELLKPKAKRGWQSQKYCSYPQELIFEFDSVIKLKQIQFLFHQYKISSKIEILINEMKNCFTDNNNFKDFNPNENESYKKIGFFFPDTNEKSDFQARELKSIHLDYQCHKIKFILHRNHGNMNNIFNQVGIVGLSVYGVELISIKDINEKLKLNENPNKKAIEDLNINTRQAALINNYQKINNVYLKFKDKQYNDHNEVNNQLTTDNQYRNANGNKVNLINNINFEKSINTNNNITTNYNQSTYNSYKTNNSNNISKNDQSLFTDKINYLNAQKEKAVSEEDYDKAKLICDYVRKLRDLSDKIVHLAIEKKKAIENEDYEKAKIIKKEIESLKILADQGNENNLFFHEINFKKINPSLTKQNYINTSNNSNYNTIDAKNNNYNSNDKNSIEIGNNNRNYFLKQSYENSDEIFKRRILNYSSDKQPKKIANAYNFNNQLNQGNYRNAYNFDKRMANQLNSLMDSTQQNNLEALYHSVELKPSNKNLDYSRDFGIKKGIDVGKINKGLDYQTIELVGNHNPRIRNPIASSAFNQDKNLKFNKIMNYNSKGKMRIEELNNSAEVINRNNYNDLNKRILSPKAAVAAPEQNNYNNKRKVFNRQITEIFGNREDNIESLTRSTEAKPRQNIDSLRDDRAIKGIDKDFSEFVMEKLKIDSSILKKEKEVFFKKIQNNNVTLDVEKNELFENLNLNENSKKNKILDKNKNNINKVIGDCNREAEGAVDNGDAVKSNRERENDFKSPNTVESRYEKGKKIVSRSNKKKNEKAAHNNVENKGKSNDLIFDGQNTNQLKEKIASILRSVENLNNETKPPSELNEGKNLDLNMRRKSSNKSHKTLNQKAFETKEVNELTKITERVLTEENLLTKTKENEKTLNQNNNDPNEIKSLIPSKAENTLISNENKILEENENSVIIINDAKPLYEHLSYNFIKMLFSKNWKIREKALKLMDAEILNFPEIQSASVFGMKDSKDIYFAVAYSTAYIFSSNFLPLFIICLNLFKNTLAKFQQEKELFQLIQRKKTELNSLTVKSIELIIENLGDMNPKIKEIVEAALIEISVCTLIGEKLILEILINGKSKDSKGKSAKFLLAKLSVVNKIINMHGVFRYAKSILIDNIVDFAFGGFSNVNKDIREEGLNLLHSLYFSLGKEEEFLVKYFKNADAKLLNAFMQRISFDSNTEHVRKSVVKPDKTMIPHDNSYLRDSVDANDRQINKRNFLNNKNKDNKIFENDRNTTDNPVIRSRPYSSKNENSRNSNNINNRSKNDISNVDYNNESSIKIIINNNNFNYNYKNKNSNKVNLKSANEDNNINVFRSNAKVNKKKNEDREEILNLNNSIDKILLRNKDEGKIALMEKRENKFPNFKTIDNNDDKDSNLKPIYLNMNKYEREDKMDKNKLKSSYQTKVENVVNSESDQEEQIEINYKVEKQICSYCGFYDKDLKSIIKEHINEWCPWFTKCSHCTKVVEIANLNNHFISQCTIKDKFASCFKCKEAIMKKDYENHIKDNTCASVKNNNYYNRCPLCHSDHTPSGVLGWQMHLLEDGCPLNPRNII